MAQKFGGNMQFFPIFTALKGRRVLLIGAGSIALHKAESLLAAGAALNVIARELSEPFQQWQASGRITHLAQEFTPEAIAGHFLVVAGTNDRALNAAVFQAAEAAGVLCNAVDDPAHCSYITPALIDRGPLQIAVSSSAAAPVLARYWRNRIEELVPLHAGRLAAFAGKWRSLVKNRIKGISERRRFWENLFSGAINDAIARDDENAAFSHLQQAIDSRRRFAGEVALVGAGPGDPGLLTLHALQAIQAADIVYYDALVSPEIIAKIRKDADKICVGKRAGTHSTAQNSINAQLIASAQKGLRAVRLKGGDPFVFGRGGEECQELAAAGIAFRIIPGVTAAIGATAYAGIPLTHRSCAQAAVFITGHCQEGSDIDWKALARAKQTLAIYMGTVKAAAIQAALIAHGRSPDTPAAIISNGSCPNQTVAEGTLADLACMAKTAPRPALIIIGEVAALRRELDWYRPQHSAAAQTAV